MFKITVTNPNKIGSPFSASFPTREEAQQWFDQCVNKPSKPFGLPEHQEEVLDVNEMPFEPRQFITIPSEFTVEIIDISTQINQERINAQALAYLASTDWLIIREMDEGTPCPAEIKAERVAARARIVR